VTVPEPAFFEKKTRTSSQAASLLPLLPTGHVWVKICGFSDPEHVELSVRSGVDALGVVLHPPSPRHVSLAHALELRQVAQAVRPDVHVLAVTVDWSFAALADLVTATGVTGLQLHGDEPASLVAQLQAAFPGLLLVKATGRPPRSGNWGVLDARGADAVLVDASTPGPLPGGTGTRLCWQRPQTDVPVLLAGGLTSENVGEALSVVLPYGVDVSSGVETAPGVKDPGKILQFLDAVRSTS